MQPRFRFLYVLAAAAVTYGALAAFRVPRYDGPHRGWIYGHEHGFRGDCGYGRHAGYSCGAAAPAQPAPPAVPAAPAAPQPPAAPAE